MHSIEAINIQVETSKTFKSFVESGEHNTRKQNIKSFERECLPLFSLSQSFND